MGRILIVDDEKDLVQLIGYMLTKEGHQIETANDGLEALEKLKLDDPAAPLPDMVVMDVMMPRMDGHELYQKLREHPRAKELPVVVLTAKGNRWEEFQNESALCAYIDKPFDPQYLRDLVRDTLARRGARHGL
jgi:two-component system, OmpR family, alkaline phosphatase synthesis response regulator PhoP